MKKFILLMMLLLSSVFSYSQKIQSDKVIDGQRIIMMKGEIINSVGYTWTFARLSMVVCNDSSKLILSLRTTEIPTSEGFTLILKLKNNDLLRYTNHSFFEESLYTVPKMFRECSNTQFEISESDIRKIAQFGIDKMRLENEKNYKTRDFTSQKLSKYLGKALPILKERSLREYDISEGL